jgi:hypothetical protein
MLPSGTTHDLCASGTKPVVLAGIQKIWEIRMLVTRTLGLMLCVATSGLGGIVVTRSSDGIRYMESAAVLINGKDKAISVGNEPKITAAAKNLIAVPLKGVLIKDTEAHALCLFDSVGKRYLVPQPVPKKGALEVAALWSGAKITSKKTASDKSPEEIPLDSFVAFLPGGVEDLAKLAADEGRLALIGGKSGYFPVQMELISSAVRSYGSEPAMAEIEKYVEGSMRGCSDQFETGTAGVDVLQRGLQFATLSEAAYPKSERQQTLRASLRTRKSWMDRKQAVLKAMSAARQWDAFLLAYAGIERYAWSLPEIVRQHQAALHASLVQHTAAGDERKQANEHYAAWREFRTASQRKPSDRDTQAKAAAAWAEYAAQYAVEHQRERAQLSVGERTTRDTELRMALLNKTDNKLDDALRHVDAAAKIDPASVDVLYTRADILSARGETARALKALDDYDLRAATEDEQKKGLALRADLQHQLEKLSDRKNQMRKDWEAMNFTATRVHAIEALRTKEDDADLLYYAGLASLATRRPKDGGEYLRRYLLYSDTLDADPAGREDVRRLISMIREGSPEEAGEPNWFSGKKLPDGVYYCPVSLAFQARVDRITTSSKLTLDFNWDGDRLKSIAYSVEKNAKISAPKPLYFTYAEGFPQLYSATPEKPAPAATDPDTVVRQSAAVLENNPYVDPFVVKQLTGKDIGVVFSGDRFFSPFTWDKLYHFRVSYDEAGRIRTARLLRENGAGEDSLLLECDWDGNRLRAIRGYEIPNGDENARAKVYERVLTYQEQKLVSEEIRERGNTRHIKYSYSGDDLASAEWDHDSDGNYRKITFASPQASRRRK